ncbi:MAG: ArsR/SmtB family transcription factor [Phycisphaerales bacterium]
MAKARASTTPDFRRTASIAKALSSEARCRILHEIADAKELTCSDVCERFHLSQATISHHLQTLERAGLIRVRREGLYHYLTVDHEALRGFAESLRGKGAPKKTGARKRPSRKG